MILIVLSLSPFLVCLFIGYPLPTCRHLFFRNITKHRCCADLVEGISVAASFGGRQSFPKVELLDFDILVF